MNYRRFEYGSPFVNENSGRFTVDKANEKKLRMIMSKYLSQAREEGVEFEAGAAQVKMPYAVGTLCGAVFAKFYTDAFCSPKYV